MDESIAARIVAWADAAFPDGVVAGPANIGRAFRSIVEDAREELAGRPIPPDLKRPPTDTKLDNPCLTNAQDDEPLFVLMGRDRSAPKLTIMWLAENIETVTEEKAYAALRNALLLRAYHTRKDPD